MAASLEEDEPRSLLLLGRPGMGKTTLLRDIARLMSVPSEEGGLGLRVVVIDTSNEISGDGDEAHACIGWARRMQVATRADQHRVGGWAGLALLSGGISCPAGLLSLMLAPMGPCPRHASLHHSTALLLDACWPQVMLEAVQNHTPQVLIIDEIGTREVGGTMQSECTAFPMAYTSPREAGGHARSRQQPAHIRCCWLQG